MARQLTARGDRVAAAARRTEELEELAEEVAPHPGSLTIHPLDVTDTEAVVRVVRHADAVHGGLDVVVVNAGRGGGARLGTGRMDENLAVVDVNLVGALAQIEAALSLFRPRSRGQLVLVSSMAGDRALPGSAAVYSASKAALSALGESLRTELHDVPITVTTLRPGYVETPLTEGNRSPLMTPLADGVEAMIAAMDRRADDTPVPSWPWRPLGWVLRVAPPSLIRRFS